VLYRNTSSLIAAICTALDMEPTILILTPILMPIIKQGG
jgi:TRAP-type C4-dicarboxylate transport system permease large subunit